MQTLYFAYANGGVGYLEVSDGMGASYPEDTRPISKVEYDDARADLERQHAEHKARILAEERETQRGDYEVLLGLGVPPAMATRLSGYTPDGA